MIEYNCRIHFFSIVFGSSIKTYHILSHKIILNTLYSVGAIHSMSSILSQIKLEKNEIITFQNIETKQHTSKYYIIQRGNYNNDKNILKIESSKR